ncbi:MAG: efflux RND transporter periplasmic adaptor subunit [Verrucomicrobiota bacterium]|jgi:HlyD family secretion protein
MTRHARWKIAALVIVAALALLFILKSGDKETSASSFTVRRGNLQINVLEGGSVEALEFQEVRSEVKGYQGVKILSIVEEGYQVTEEDVKSGKVLVELDSSELRQRIVTQDIDYQAKRAALTEAQQAYEIQLTQNLSDIKAAEQKAKFALLDLEKYLGDQVTKEVIALAKLKLPHQISGLTMAEFDAPSSRSARPDPAITNTVLKVAEQIRDAVPLASPESPVLAGGVVNAKPIEVAGSVPSRQATPTSSPPPSNSDPGGNESAMRADIAETLNQLNNRIQIDFSKYAKVELLGDGEAQQKLREAKDNLLLAEKERSSSESKLAGTDRLFQKGFVTKTELETARLEFEQVNLKVKKSATALTLFIKYEFIKMSEELLSKYDEALRLLERARKEAVSKLAQAKAKLMSAESQFQIVEKNRRELEEQVEKCTIRAKKPGLVVYGGNNTDGVYFYSEERIREGALIRERQPIITIPDTTHMSVKVKIPEAHIKKIKKGMQARVRVEAFPDEKLTGEVTKVAPLPDAQNRWMNPDMKVYMTTIKIEGTHSWLKPGMTAKVEIMVNELQDAIFVPIQAVTPHKGEQVCFIVNGGKPERRVVEVGEFNEEFIEIKKGLREGEKVFLRAPDGTREEESEKTPDTPAPAPESAAGKTARL